MKLETAKDLLAGLFTTVKVESTGEERTCFKSEYMDKDSGDKFEIYKAVSDAMYSSGFTHDFSYEIGSRAAQILVDLEDWDDDASLVDGVDSQTPIYNSEITMIYTANSWAVDEAREEYGAVDSIKDAQMAWYSQIENMVHSIIANLEIEE